MAANPIYLPIDRIPFTYLIGWTHLNIWYYGVRWAKHCKPTDLWNTYFTSCDKIPYYIENYGPPDFIKIDKIFNTTKRALKYERGYLWRIKKSGLWNIFINENIGGFVIQSTEKLQKIGKENSYKTHEIIKQKRELNPDYDLYYRKMQSEKAIKGNEILSDLIENAPVYKEFAKERSRKANEKQQILRKENPDYFKNSDKEKGKGGKKTKERQETNPEFNTYIRNLRRENGKKQAGSSFYNNGEKEIKIWSTDRIPKGFVKGRLYKEKPEKRKRILDKNNNICFFSKNDVEKFYRISTTKFYKMVKNNELIYL